MPQLKFRIEYATQWGESLWLTYRMQDDRPCCLCLTTDDGRIWQGRLDVPPYAMVSYAYSLRDDAGRELRGMRAGTFSVTADRDGVTTLCDHWPVLDIPLEMRHTAFTDCVFGHNNAEWPVTDDLDRGCALRMHAVPPPTGYCWGVLGEGTSLGNWQTDAVKPLRRTATYEWSLPLAPEDFGNGYSYKYVLVHNDRPTVPVWEEGGNRSLPRFMPAEGERAVCTDDAPRIDLPLWRGAGVVIPVFSLRSRESQGIGDFGDLRTFVVWAASVGFKAVQVLPINDTTSSATWRDSYPYNGVSVFALHPLYLDLREWADLPLFEGFAERAAALNALPQLDYEGVLALKTEFLVLLFLLQGKEVMASADYERFHNDNKSWLVPYAHFALDKARSLRYFDAPGTDYFYFVQYLLHCQMQAAHDAAKACGVILKGDIPIGVCRDSVPATVDSRLFHFDGQAGAPPDAFDPRGQNWGFPTYNWEVMAKDGYAWWRNRLKHMGRYFDAYRIDHVLGFFRIWEVPSSQIYGIMGHFRPALPFTVEDIAGYGFSGNVAHYATAFVTPEHFAELTATHPGTDLLQYLRPTANGCYALCPELATQRQLAAALPEGPLLDDLLKVVAEVLFVVDPDGSGYHPRIGAQLTHVFAALTAADREAFNRLHDDFFYHRHNDFWGSKAMEKLPTIVTAGRADGDEAMLPCAEDLGMVPDCVKDVLGRLHILSLEIQRMPKAYGVRFGDTAQNPYLSVATIATHDMPPFRLWWHEDRGQTQQFWTDVLHGEGEAPDDATPEVCEQVVKLHLASPSMLCLNALQDYLGIDERLRNPHYEDEQINVPSNPNQYWRYRMHLTIEDLAAATAFNEKLRGLVVSSGR